MRASTREGNFARVSRKSGKRCCANETRTPHHAGRPLISQNFFLAALHASFKGCNFPADETKSDQLSRILTSRIRASSACTCVEFFALGRPLPGERKGASARRIRKLLGQARLFPARSLTRVLGHGHLRFSS